MDIHQYKAQLEAKLVTVNAIIAEMGEAAPAPAKRRGRPPLSTNPMVPQSSAPKGKRTMSAAGRAKIAAAAKARWAAAKKAGKTRL